MISPMWIRCVGLNGHPVLININTIVAFEFDQSLEGKAKTFISAMGSSIRVQETVDEIIYLIQKASVIPV